MPGPLVDLITLAILATSVFFVVISIVLLARYRQISSRISSSNDLGLGLWDALESRLKKQDERILDMMGRVEVIQARVVGKQVGVVQESDTGAAHSPDTPRLSDTDSMVSHHTSKSQESLSQVTSPLDVPEQVVQESNSQLSDRTSAQDAKLDQVMKRLEAIQTRMDENLSQSQVTRFAARSENISATHEATVKVDEKTLMAMLAEKPRTSVEIRERFGISREHAARVLKQLFNQQLVVRNEVHKPFVYELTEEGKRRATAS